MDFKFQTHFNIKISSQIKFIFFLYFHRRNVLYIEKEKNLDVINNNYNKIQNFVQRETYYNSLEIDLIKLKKNLMDFYKLENFNEIKLNYDMFDCLENIIPKNVLKFYTQSYEITLNFNLSYLSAVEPKIVENITYDALFLKINKEKDILFDYDIETTIYKFLENDIIQFLKKNKQFDFLIYNKINNDMKKFYADFENFLLNNSNLDFKKTLEDEIFEKNFFDFSFNENVNFEINLENNSFKDMGGFIENLEKNLIEVKNKLLKLFTETKAEFLKKEEYGLKNFIDEVFKNDENNQNLLIVGIDFNSIIFKIFNEIYLNHKIILEEDGKINEEKISKLKNIFIETFLTKNYLDVNYLFNNKNLLEKYKLNENDYKEIINIFVDNQLYKSKVENSNNLKPNSNRDDIRTITKNISQLFYKKLMNNHFNNLNEFFKTLEKNDCLNTFYLFRKNNFLTDSTDLFLLKMKNNEIIQIEEEKFKEKNKNYSFLIKFDEKKRKMIINFLRKITDFYVIFLTIKLKFFI